MNRILVVDDEVRIRDILCRKMETCGFRVEEAMDGEEAIQKLVGSQYDLVIADILMPGKDGLEVIMFVQSQQPDVKIIAISAPENEMFLDAARILGAARVFEKPFRLEEIARATQELLS